MAHVPLTARLARFSAHHPYVIIAAWLVLLALGTFAASGVGGVLGAQEMEFLNSPESARGAGLIEAASPGAESATETVIVRSSDVTVDDPAFAERVRSLTAELSGLSGTVVSAVDYYQAVQFDPAAAAALVSQDRHATLIRLTLADGADLAPLEAALAAHRAPGLQMLTIGDSSMEEVFTGTAESDLMKAEMVGLPITLFVLVLVFGAVAAAGVSLLLAGVAIVVAIGLTALVGQVFELSFFVLNMVTMIGLAVGIDYALFIIERFREERRAGASKHEAITIAGGTASKAVLFSGGTVILALAGLFLVPLSTFRSLGVGAILVVSVSVVAMLTLVPAVLSLLGDAVDWPRLRAPLWFRRKGRAVTGVLDAAAGDAAGAGGAAGPTAVSAADGEQTIFPGFWGGVARVVMHRPVISVVLTAGILLVAAVPLLDLRYGSSGAEALPQGNVRDAYEILVRDFPAVLAAPAEIVVTGGPRSGLETGIGRLQQALAVDPGFYPGAEPEWSEAGDTAVLRVPLRESAASDEALVAIDRLRTVLIPEAFSGLRAEVLVAGETAFNADSNDLIRYYTPIVFTFVLGLSFILLLLVFRSIVVPVKAIVMNLLSVGAAYGIMVVVFQKGVGHELFGFQRTPTIEPWVPIFLFCILFGLSMDYHVFLLSRIREHFLKTRRNLESVSVGLRSTGRIITGAAAIMVVVFATFASGELVMLQQVGFGLAIAVVLDATIVRMVLVPASMALLGDANWWFPRWLSWVPHVSVETALLHPVRKKELPLVKPS